MKFCALLFLTISQTVMAFTVPPIKPMSNIDYYTGVGMEFGRGYDTFSDESADVCVDISSIKSDTDKFDTIQESVFKMDLIESSYDLSKKLGVTASASLKSGFSKVSATASYINEQKLNQYSVYILISAEVLTPLEKAVGEDLKPFYVELARSNPKAFREKCGNEYVATVQKGGIFYGVLKLETSDSSSYESTKASLRANVGTFSLASDLEKTITKVVSDRSLQVFVYQIGGKSGKSPTSVSELVDRVSNFTAEVSVNPVQVKSLTNQYTKLRSFPLEVTNLDTSIQDEVLENLSNVRFKIQNQKNDINYIIINQSQFEDFVADDMNTRIDYLNQKLNEINRATKACLLDFDKCVFPENLNYKEIKLPKRLTKVVASNQCIQRTREECGIIYKQVEGPKCGVLNYNLGTGKVCGIKSYKKMRSANCPAELYKQSSGPECGVAAYNQRQDGNICGVTISGTCSMSVPIELSIKSFLGPLQSGSCFNRPNTCRDARFGVEAYNSCRHADFGIEVYAECVSPNHDIAEYNECRDESFGIATYKSCSDGITRIGISTCLLKEVLDGDIVKYIPCKE